MKIEKLFPVFKDYLWGGNKLKEKYGIFDNVEIPHATEEERNRILDNMASVANDVAKKGMTLVRNTTDFLPVDAKNIKKVKWK